MKNLKENPGFIIIIVLLAILTGGAAWFASADHDLIVPIGFQVVAITVTSLAAWMLKGKILPSILGMEIMLLLTFLIVYCLFGIGLKEMTTWAIMKYQIYVIVVIFGLAFSVFFIARFFPSQEDPDMKDLVADRY